MITGLVSLAGLVVVVVVVVVVFVVEVVSVDFNWWILKRIEKDEDWTWFEAIWLRNEKDMRF